MLMPNTESKLPVTKPYMRFIRRLKDHAGFVLVVAGCYLALLSMSIGLAELLNLLLESVL